MHAARAMRREQMHDEGGNGRQKPFDLLVSLESNTFASHARDIAGLRNTVRHDEAYQHVEEINAGDLRANQTNDIGRDGIRKRLHEQHFLCVRVRVAKRRAIGREKAGGGEGKASMK